MNDRTSTTPLTTTCPTWCDLEAGHAGLEHQGTADVPLVTATADRTAFACDDNGIIVPEVVAMLFGHDEPSGTYPKLRVLVSVKTPHSHLSADLTLQEAALLRSHLTQLLRDAGVEDAS